MPGNPDCTALAPGEVIRTCVKSPRRGFPSGLRGGSGCSRAAAARRPAKVVRFRSQEPFTISVVVFTRTLSTKPNRNSTQHIAHQPRAVHLDRFALDISGHVAAELSLVTLLLLLLLASAAADVASASSARQVIPQQSRRVRIGRCCSVTAPPQHYESEYASAAHPTVGEPCSSAGYTLARV